MESCATEKLANQLTLMEWTMMSFIRPDEFLKQRWNKSGGEVNAPNLVYAINWFNRISRWLCSEIVREESVESRAAVITNIIHLGVKCNALNNFNAVMEVLSALCSAAIARLKQSWAVRFYTYAPFRKAIFNEFVEQLLSNKSNEDFEKLSKLMSPKSNFSVYRATLQNIKVDSQTTQSYDR